MKKGGYFLHDELGHGKEKTVFRAARAARPMQRDLVAACFKPAKSVQAICREAEFQRQAAYAGIATPIENVDEMNRMLVMPLLGGATLPNVVRDQGGILTKDQQARILEILRLIGAPEAAGGANMSHNDTPNVSNFMTDAAGKFYLIDYGMAAAVSALDRKICGDGDDFHVFLLADILWGNWGLINKFGMDAKQGAPILVAAYREYESRTGKINPYAPPRDRCQATAAATEGFKYLREASRSRGQGSSSADAASSASRARASGSGTASAPIELEASENAAETTQSKAKASTSRSTSRSGPRCESERRAKRTCREGR